METDNMYLIDSSCWLEYFAGTKYAKIISEIVLQPDKIIVPTIIIYEIYKKILIEKNDSIANFICNRLKQCNVVDLDYDLAVLAAAFGKTYKLPMADSIIYATAQKFSCVLYTFDSHFANLENVIYIEKK